MSIIPKNVLDQKTQSENKAVYLKASGDDTNDGASWPTAVQNWETATGGIAKASLLSPTVNAPVTINCDSAAIFSPTTSLNQPDHVNIQAPGSRFFGPSGLATFNCGENTRLVCDTVEHTDDTVLNIDGNSFVFVKANVIKTDSTTDSTIKFSNFTVFNRIDSNFIEGGFRLIDNQANFDSGNTTIEADTFNIDGPSAIGVYQNSPHKLGVTFIDFLNPQNSAGVTGVEAVSGRVDLLGIKMELGPGTAIRVRSGATCYITCNSVEGNIIVESGGTLIANINDFTGTITGANEDIKGKIGPRLFDNLCLENNLTAFGEQFNLRSSIINIAGPYDYRNSEETAVAPKSGGFVHNYLPTTTTDTVSSGSFTPGVAATSNPSVNTAGSGTFSSGDFIQITDTEKNNGLFEVEDHTGNTLKVKGVGTSAKVEAFGRDQFITETSDATITKVNISVLRCNTSGVWESGKGSSTPLTYLSVDGTNWGDIVGTLSSQTDLQAALNAKLALAGGTMSGDIDMGSNNISNAGTVNGITLTTGGAATDFLNGSGSYSVPIKTWGELVGTLSDQTDLQAALDAKVDLAGDNLTGNLDLGGNDLLDVDNLELSDDDTNKITLKAPANVTADYSLVFPPAIGSTGQHMALDGSGNLEWVADELALWGNIGGTINLQSDLQAALDSKLNLSGGALTGAVTSTSTFTGTSFNGVALTNAGSASNFLQEDGSYGTVDWGDIAGTLSSQSDLQSAFDAKLDLAGGTITGSLIINQDLIVQGNNFITNTEEVSIEDGNILLNSNHTSAFNKTGGLTVVATPTATQDTVSSGVFTAGVASTSNPTVVTDGSGTFTANDLVLITTSNDGENDGLFEVDSHVGTTLTIKGVGTTATVESFTNNQFVTNTSDSCTITKVSIDLLSTNSSGDWERASGSTVPLTKIKIADQGDIDLKVSKSGDTMSGDLNLGTNDLNSVGALQFTDGSDTATIQAPSVSTSYTINLPAAAGTTGQLLALSSPTQFAFIDNDAAVWGSITGTLSNQTDLQNALDAKLSLSGGAITGAVTSTSSWTGTTFNGVALTTGGVATNFLDETGSYSTVDWGDIAGTLSNQADLQSALDAKLSLSGGALTGAVTSSSTFTGTSFNGVALTAGGGGSNFLSDDGTYSVPVVSWGDLVGTLADQTDLQSELDGKLSLTGGTLTGPVTSSSSFVGSTFNGVALTTGGSANEFLNGTGNYSTIGITIDQMLHVSKNGNDGSGDGSLDNPFLTVKAAVDHAATLTPSSSNPYVVKVGPGVFTEDPFTIVPHVNLQGSGDKTVISASNANADLITISVNTTVTYISVTGVTNAANFLINCSSTAAGECFLDNISLISASNGINCTSTVTGYSSVITKLFSKSCTADILTFEANTDVVISTGSFIGNGSTTNGFVAEGGSIRVYDVTIEACDYAFVVNSNDGELRIYGLDVNSDTKPADQNALATVYVFGGRIDTADASFIDALPIHGYFYSDVEGVTDSKFTILDELSVGIHGNGRESHLGEGDSSNGGMFVYTETDVGVFTSETAAARSGVSSTFTFTGTAANHAIYVSTATPKAGAGTPLTWSGLRIDVTTAASGGEIVAEYWNGSAWTEFNHMSTETTGEYLPYAKEVFQRTGSEHIRFDKTIADDWATNDPVSLGLNLYWVRFRIDSALTTAPVFEQWKVVPNTTAINEDGFIEYFGEARPVDVLPFSMGSLYAANASPSDQDIYFGDNLGVGRIENEFFFNTVDRTGIAQVFPFDIDTSNPIKLIIHAISDEPNSGSEDVDFRVRWSNSFNDERVYGTTASPSTAPREQELTQVVSFPTVENTQFSFSFDLDVSDIIPRRTSDPGDIFWLTIQRDNDGNTANIIILDITLEYTKWCNGGHQ